MDLVDQDNCASGPRRVVPATAERGPNEVVDGWSSAPPRARQLDRVYRHDGQVESSFGERPAQRSHEGRLPNTARPDNQGPLAMCEATTHVKCSDQRKAGDSTLLPHDLLPDCGAEVADKVPELICRQCLEALAGTSAITAHSWNRVRCGGCRLSRRRRKTCMRLPGARCDPWRPTGTVEPPVRVGSGEQCDARANLRRTGVTEDMGRLKRTRRPEVGRPLPAACAGLGTEAHQLLGDTRQCQGSQPGDLIVIPLPGIPRRMVKRIRVAEEAEPQQTIDLAALAHDECLLVDPEGANHRPPPGAHTGPCDRRGDASRSSRRSAGRGEQ